jgi:hypothetical protein
MDHLSVAVSAFRARLAGVANSLFGCSHRRTAFPVTFPASASADGPHSTQAEVYVVCLDCGHHLVYDWTTMRVTRQSAAWAGRTEGRVDDDTV